MENLRLLLSLSLWGCFVVFSSAQTASITAGCSPLEVSFTPPSGQTSFFWEFGTGATSTLANPSNIFVQTGTYEVTLKESVDGDIVGTLQINVYAKPEATLAVDPTFGCTPLDVNFDAAITNNPAININSIEWAFGDGNTTIDNDVTTHTYNTVGTFDVSLALNTNIPSCNTTINFTEQVATSSIEGVNFLTNPHPASACEPPLEVSFINFTENNDKYTFNWDLGDGTTFEGHTPPPHIYTELGEFTVTLTVSNEDGCSEMVSRIVSIGSIAIETGIPDTVCIDQAISANPLISNYTHDWSYDNAAILYEINPITQQEEFTFIQGGTFDISLAIYPPDGCADTIYQTIYVDDPVASFESDPSYSCSVPLDVNFTDTSPDAVDWIWVLPDGETVTGSPTASTTLEYPDIDPYGEYGLVYYPTTLTIISTAGCAATIVKSDSIYRPDAKFMPDVINGCAPLTVMFSDSSSTLEDITYWEYDFGDGQNHISTTEGDVSHTFDTPGEYEVGLIIENAGGCRDTSYTVTISVGQPAKINFTSSTYDGCIGDTIYLNDVSNYGDLEIWHFYTPTNTISSCYTEDSVPWIPTNEVGPIPVSLTVSHNGCFSTLTKNTPVYIHGPQARIDYHIDCESPFTVSFRDSTLDATIYHWDFGDGNTSDQNAPTHTYTETGDYTVILTAENPETGCDISVDSTVVHIRDIQADFILPEHMCSGVDTILNAALSIDVEAHCNRGYEWYFGDAGRPIESEFDYLEFNFPNPGLQTVTLVVEDINGCRDTTTKSLSVYHVDAEIITAPTLVCAEGTVPFDFELTAEGDTTLVDWEWNFGDGSTGNGVSTSHIFNEIAGNIYTVDIIVTDVLGCEGENSIDIPVYVPSADIMASIEPSNLCVGEELTLSASPVSIVGNDLAFNWDFGPFGSSTDSSNVVTFTQDGEFEIILNSVEIATGCPGSSSHFVNVQSYPMADFSTSVDGQGEVCYPAQIEFMNQSDTDYPTAYTWDFDNGNTSFIEDPTIGFGKGTFNIELIASTSFGCRDTFYKDVTLIGPEGDFIASPTTICVGEEVDFILIDTSDVANYTWNFGDGVSIDNENPISHTYNTLPPSGSTVATLILEGETGGCSFGIEKVINIDGIEADFQINGGDETTFCEDEISFANSSVGTTTYSWDFGDGTTSNDENPSHVFMPGEYEVSLTVSNDNSTCDGLVVKPVTIVEPFVWADIDTFMCNGATHIPLLPELPSNAVFSWDETPPFTPEESTEYLFSVMDTINNCFNDTYSYYVDVIGGDTEIEIPNVFTPNGDGINDIFMLHTSDDFFDYATVSSFRLWDRWGNTIIDTSGDSIEWDGKFKGKISPSDVYIYKITITQSCDGSSYDMEGEVTLLR